LVDIAHEQHSRVIWQSSEELGHQDDIDHRDLIHDDQISPEGIRMIMHKTPGGWLKLQQTMDGFGFQPCRLCQTFGGTSSRCPEQHVHLLGLENLENTGDNGRFADPRPAGDYRDFAPQGHRHSIPLGG
jgi:hypothetical protein